MIEKLKEKMGLLFDAAHKTALTENEPKTGEYWLNQGKASGIGECLDLLKEFETAEEKKESELLKELKISTNLFKELIEDSRMDAMLKVSLKIQLKINEGVIAEAE